MLTQQVSVIVHNIILLVVRGGAKLLTFDTQVPNN